MSLCHTLWMMMGEGESDGQLTRRSLLLQINTALFFEKKMAFVFAFAIQR